MRKKRGGRGGRGGRWGGKEEGRQREKRAEGKHYSSVPSKHKRLGYFNKEPAFIERDGERGVRGRGKERESKREREGKSERGRERQTDRGDRGRAETVSEKGPRKLMDESPKCLHKSEDLNVFSHSNEKSERSFRKKKKKKDERTMERTCSCLVTAHTVPNTGRCRPGKQPAT